METFRDFLKGYNNLDVKPFVKGVLNYCKMYWKENIDVTFNSRLSKVKSL